MVNGAFALFLVVGIAAGCGKAATTGNRSKDAIAGTTSGSTVGSSAIAHEVRLRPTQTQPTTKRSAKPAAQASPSSKPAETAPQAPDPATNPPSGTAATLSCPAFGSTSAAGCGSWDAGPSSGQAPGFAAGQQSSSNLLSVNQDPWTGGQGPQVLTASQFQQWSVTATDTDPSNAPGEVLTYPDASFNYYEVDTAASGYSAPPPQYDLNNITSLTSEFTESMPQLSNLNAEAAYDLWLNNWQTEVMVWVDTSPAKDRNLADDGMTQVGTYVYDGQNFALWRSGSGITGFYVFLLDHNETSGSVDLKAMLQTLVSLNYIPATSPLTQIPFGWEISDTGGAPVTFSMSGFEVSLQN
jgi:Glycosyl hydrolase family 12